MGRVDENHDGDINRALTRWLKATTEPSTAGLMLQLQGAPRGGHVTAS
jgi:hypothetical protein